MIIPVTFELYPPQEVINASRYGSEPCAPPLLSLPHQELEISPEILTRVLRHDPIYAGAAYLKERPWRIRVGCGFVPCPTHGQTLVYLRADYSDWYTLAGLVPPLQAGGWLVNEDALAAYRPKK